MFEDSNGSDVFPGLSIADEDGTFVASNNGKISSGQPNFVQATLHGDQNNTEDSNNLSGAEASDLLKSQQSQHNLMLQLLRNAAAASGTNVSNMYGMLGLSNASGQMSPQHTIDTDKGKDDMKKEEQNMWHV